MKRAFAICCAVFSILSFSALPAAAAPAITQTQQIRVRPVTPAGDVAAGYHVVASASGASCFPGSDVIAGAYRCFAGNVIYDPCWGAAGTSPQVVCLLQPWSHSLYRLYATADLGPTPVFGLQPIWGVEIAGGNECVEADSASQPVDGQVISYYCAYGLVVLGQVDDHHTIWTALTARLTNGHYAVTGVRQVKIAWFARPSLYQ